MDGGLDVELRDDAGDKRPLFICRSPDPGVGCAGSPARSDP